MSNPAELLQEIQKLMELKGENPFKIRAYEKAIQVLSGRTDIPERVQKGTLTELPGIGKGIAEVIAEFTNTGSSSLARELRESIPK
jgi:DNA polymerase (family 10)